MTKEEFSDGIDTAVRRLKCTHRYKGNRYSYSCNCIGSVFGWDSKTLSGYGNLFNNSVDGLWLGIADEQNLPLRETALRLFECYVLDTGEYKEW